MSEFFSTHPKTKWFGIVCSCLALMLVLFLAVFDWNSLRPAVARLITAKTGRPASIQGDLKVHLWSWNPSAQLNGLTLKNPNWAEHDVMFSAKQLTVSLSLGRLLRGQVVLPQVAVVRPSIDLERDAQGRASWELGNAAGTPRKSAQPAKIPVIRRLTIEEGHIRVSDRIRKLILNGSLTAADEADRADTAAFQLRLTGSLNAKPFRALLTGGPLINLTPDRPYHLEAHLNASDIT